MNWKHSILAGFMALCAPAAFAQLSGNVSVEGIYKPIVVETERLNTFPQSYRFELPAADISYEYTGIVTDFRPGLLTMGVTGRFTERPLRRRNGFVDFRIGSWLNTRLHAGCDIVNDSVNSLTADLRFLSSTLYRTRGVPEWFSRPARKRLYDGRFGLDYSRLLGEEGLLTANASYRASYFNYYGTSVPLEWLPVGTECPGIPTQTLNRADAGVRYESSPSFIRGWHLGADVNYTAYRRLYSPATFGEESAGGRETTLKASAGYDFPAGEHGAVAVDIDGDFIFPGKGHYEALGLTDLSIRNYGVVTIRPSFRLMKSGLRLQAGVNLAASYDAMGRKPGEGFGAMHVAPDVLLEYVSRSGVGLFLHAGGGATPSTLAMREEFDRYQLPVTITTAPVFSPLDLRFGVNIGPFAGFSASLSGRYASVKNVPLGGWYQAYLGAYLPGGFSFNPALWTDPWLHTVNLHGFNAALSLQYAWGTRASLSFEGSYTPQKGYTGIFNGYDRPRWILSAKGMVRPIERLGIEAGYEYRGVRNCYALVSLNGGTILSPCRLPDVTALGAKVSYRVLDNLEIYCKGENLLNRRVELLPGLQSEGITVYGGLFVTF